MQNQYHFEAAKRGIIYFELISYMMYVACCNGAMANNARLQSGSAQVATIWETRSVQNPWPLGQESGVCDVYARECSSSARADRTPAARSEIFCYLRCGWPFLTFSPREHITVRRRALFALSEIDVSVVLCGARRERDARRFCNSPDVASESGKEIHRRRKLINVLQFVILRAFLCSVDSAHVDSALHHRLDPRE